MALYCPDVNIIENVWALIKRKVNKTNVNTEQELHRALCREWIDAVGTQTKRARFIKSMPNRVRSLILKEGAYGKY